MTPPHRSLDLLAALDIVGFESVDGRNFRAIERLPDAVQRSFKGLPVDGTEFELAREFPFLAPFLEDADEFWRRGGSGAQRSGVWTQVDDNGAECQLEATALSEESGGRVVLLEFVGAEFQRMQGILQSARENSLAMAQLERARAALEQREAELRRIAIERAQALAELEVARDSLETRVIERTAALHDANRRLVEANRDLVDHRQQLRSLLDQIATVEERERRRIASYLHDHVCQSLALVRMQMGAFGKRVGDDEGQTALQAIVARLEHAIGETRSLTFDLGSSVLYELGLESAIENLVARFRREHGIRAEFRDDRSEKPVGPDVLPVLFQTVRELLHNAIKHARPRRVDVWMRRAATEDALEITVSDDGDGFVFDPSQHEFRPTERGGFGLFQARERLGLFGGSLAIRSGPTQGASVTLRVPLRDAVPG